MKNIHKLLEKMQMRRKVALVDFDGVIHGFRQGWKDGVPYDEPVPGCKEALEKLRAKGYRIYIHSARFCPIIEFNKPCWPDQEQVKLVTEYLRKHHIPFDGLIPKAIGDVYIDDNAIRCNPFEEPENSWEEVLKKC